MNGLAEINFKKKSKINDKEYSKLKNYLRLLKISQKNHNLISNKAFATIWDRHFLDSYQILKIIGKEKKILDIGGGAGFPAIVCAICSNNYFNIVESNKKKCNFLNEVKIKLDLKNVKIHNSRVESLELIDNIDFITARAVASLTKLLKYSLKFTKKKTKCIFLKGKSVFKEIKIAKNNYTFNMKCLKSITSNEGNILFIENLKKK
tara:strand:+ start:1809 stop:2426 length:618 start_codon:yes stop_codon:yes gene_type:complete